MAYNGVFPMGYQPAAYVPQYVVPQPQPQAQPQQTQPQTAPSGIIWVQGEAGAKSYMVAPNNTAQLWDSEAQVIYLKSADASGMPSMKILDYTIREQNTQPQSALMHQTEYVTHEELSAFEDKIRKMLKEDDDNGKPAF